MLLAQAADNPVLTVLVESLTSILRGVVPRLETPDHTFVIRARRRLLTLLRKGEVDAAAAELDKYLVRLHRRWLKSDDGRAIHTVPIGLPGRPAARGRACPIGQLAVPSVRPAVPSVRPAVPSVRHAVPSVRHAVPSAPLAVPNVQLAVPSAPLAVPNVQLAVPSAPLAVLNVRHGVAGVRLTGRGPGARRE